MRLLFKVLFITIICLLLLLIVTYNNNDFLKKVDDTNNNNNKLKDDNSEIMSKELIKKMIAILWKLIITWRNQISMAI